MPDTELPRTHKRAGEDYDYRHVRILPESGFLNGNIPVYAKIAKDIGVPAITSFLLIYLLFQVIPNLQKSVDAHILQSSNNYELYKQVLDKESENYRMLQRICVRESKTDAERNGCFDK